MSTRSPAHEFELYGWRPDSNISDDENYLDVVMLITRSVQGDGQQGHMGALIVRPKQQQQQQQDERSRTNKQQHSSSYESEFFQSIIGAATNTPLFCGKDVTSDIHAEINALGQVCRSSQSTEGCTAYITIHPCKRCFAALVTFGIRRIVCRRESPPLICQTAAARNIQVSHLSYQQQQSQMKRINQLVSEKHTDEQLMEIAMHIQEQRKERKWAAKERKQKSLTSHNRFVNSDSVTCNTASRLVSLPQRRLWLSPEDLSNLSQNIKSVTTMKSTDDTYESLFQKFSCRPQIRPLTFYLRNTLTVGQEFVLTCILLAGHRAAMIEEDQFLRLHQPQYAPSRHNFNGGVLPVQSDRLWMALMLIWSTLVISVLQTRFATSQQYQLGHRVTDFALMAIILRFLSAVLRTLTASYSSDTVYALSIGASSLHLLTCDYAYANGWNEEMMDNASDTMVSDHVYHRPIRRKRPLFKGGTLSLTSVFFATALLASRLQSNITVYIFVCFSVVLFALYPAARHLVAIANTPFVPMLITGIFTSALLVLLDNQLETVLVVVTLFVILVIVPIWKHHLQQFKVLLRGPWDIAHV